MTILELKFELKQQCKDLIKLRYDSINKTIFDIEYSLKEESKSTSGDKHHTGRAMLQIERENAGNQLREIEKVMHQLGSKISKLPMKQKRWRAGLLRYKMRRN